MSDKVKNTARTVLWRNLTLAVGSLSAAVAIWMLSSNLAGLSIVTARIGTTPVTIFSSNSADRAPVVVIAHGFAGSQQLMQAFATTLAHAGMIAVTFDFLGHGRNPQQLTGNITEVDGATRSLLNQLRNVVAFARSHPQSNGQIALLGHSMASDILVRYAQSDPQILATVAVSMFSPAVTATTPRNLLVIVGALEPALKEEALRAVALANGGDARADATFGSFSDGTARRAQVSPGVEHVGVLYSRTSLTAALQWLESSFGWQAAPAGRGLVDTRGLWIGLLFLPSKWALPARSSI